MDLSPRFCIAAIIENPDSGFDAFQLAEQRVKASLKKIPSIPYREAYREPILRPRRNALSLQNFFTYVVLLSSRLVKHIPKTRVSSFTPSDFSDAASTTKTMMFDSQIELTRAG